MLAVDVLNDAQDLRADGLDVLDELTHMLAVAIVLVITADVCVEGFPSIATITTTSWGGRRGG